MCISVLAEADSGCTGLEILFFPFSLCLGGVRARGYGSRVCFWLWVVGSRGSGSGAGLRRSRDGPFSGLKSGGGWFENRAYFLFLFGETVLGGH